MSECWLYARAMTKNGYGLAWDGSKMVYAHRLMYEYYKGEIPEGLEIDHLCRVRSCINPEHLEAVTRRINTLRGLGPTMLRQRQLSKTHCPRGHKYDYFLNRGNGERGCLTCRRQASRRYRERNEQCLQAIV